MTAAWGLTDCPSCWGPRSAGDVLHLHFRHRPGCTWAEAEAHQVRMDVALYGLGQPVQRHATPTEAALLRALDADLPRRGWPLLEVSWPAGGRRHRVYDHVDIDSPAEPGLAEGRPDAA